MVETLDTSASSFPAFLGVKPCGDFRAFVHRDLRCSVASCSSQDIIGSIKREGEKYLLFASKLMNLSPARTYCLLKELLTSGVIYIPLHYSNGRIIAFLIVSIANEMKKILYIIYIFHRCKNYPPTYTK